MGKRIKLESVVAERTDRIRQVVEDCIDRRAAGEVVSDETLIAAHPDLMPELESALLNLQLVQEARLETEHFSRAGLHIRCPHCQNPIEVVDEPSLSELACPSCGSQFHVTDDSERTFGAARGEMVNHFQLLERVGAGAFGSVWSARDTQLDRTVALKIPRKGQMGPNDQEQFIREARSAAQLKHPGIVRVLEVGRYKDRIYIAYDFIKGMDLAEWLEFQQPTPREAAELCSTVAEALQHAHEHGVIHRDLKPSNVMLDTSGEPHLMDFGLAKREAAEVTMTLDGKLLGTPAYMSPEQARGEAHTADARSDVYSLGVILFEMLTGERPFRGSTRMLLHQVLMEDAPSPRRLCQVVPRDLETICLKCLEKGPNRRYETAGELRDDLTRFLAGEPVRARPITSAGRTWRWCKRRPLLSAALAFMAVLFLSTLVTWQRSETLSKQLRVNLYEAEMAGAYDGWNSGELSRVEELMCKQMVYDGKEDLRGFEWYYLADLCSDNEAESLSFNEMVLDVAMDERHETVFALQRNGEIVKIDLASRQRTTVYPLSNQQGFEPRCLAVSNNSAVLAVGGQLEDGSGRIDVRHLNGNGGFEAFTEQWVQNVKFSADGTWLACYDKMGMIHLWNATTTELQWKREFVMSPYKPPLEFSPDQRTLVTARAHGSGGTVVFWDVSTGSKRKHIEKLGSYLRDIEFSPDGARIAVVGTRLHVLDSSTLQPIREIYRRHLGYAHAVAFSPDGHRLAVGNEGNAVTILDLETSDVLARHPHRELVYFLAYSLDGTQLFSASHRTFRIRNLDQEVTRQKIRHNTWGTTIAVDNAANRIAFPGTEPENEVVLWDLDKSHADRLAGHEAPVMSVAFSHDGGLLASGDRQGVIRIWDANTKAQLREVQLKKSDGRPADVIALACSPLQDLLVASGRSGVSGWHMRTGRALWSNIGHGTESIVFSPDGRMFTAGGDGNLTDQGLVTVWDVDRTPQQIQQVTHDRWVHQLAICHVPDEGKTLLAAGDRATEIVLYDATRRLREHARLLGHTIHVTHLEFDPSGKTLMSSSFDRTLRFWRVASGRQVGIIPSGDYVAEIKCLPLTRHKRLFLTKYEEGNDLILREINVSDPDVSWMQRRR